MFPPYNVHLKVSHPTDVKKPYIHMTVLLDVNYLSHYQWARKENKHCISQALPLNFYLNIKYSPSGGFSPLRCAAVVFPLL